MSVSFEERVRAFLDANAPLRSDPVDDGLDVTRQLPGTKAFCAALSDAGLAALTYPVEYGGQGLDASYDEIYKREASRYRLPTAPVAISHGMCLPVLNDFGTHEQKAAHMRAVIRADEIWCQMFSEPGAGSDVAAIQTSAVLDGDEWVLDGQKVWTSTAHFADYGLCVARTDPDLPKHKGLSMFIIDMRAPGVEVRPLRQITGDAHFSEVFLTEVRLPADYLVGERTQGWNVAVAMLMYERVAIGASGDGAGRLVATSRRLIDLAQKDGRSAEPVVRQQLADLVIRERVQRYTGMRIRAAKEAGKAPGPEGSIAKLAAAGIASTAAGLAMELAGPPSQAWVATDDDADRWAMGVVNAPALGIAGGTNEIQRNIIGERVLGLPKEPDPYKGKPFREIPTSVD